LESLRVASVPPWKHAVSVIVGLVLMAIGLSLITLIILAGLELL